MSGTHIHTLEPRSVLGPRSYPLKLESIHRLYPLNPQPMLIIHQPISLFQGRALGFVHFSTATTTNTTVFINP
ncbi:MAG: hypothetical protein Q7S64_03225 [bacterium]|nr:hypothetical protein [bacterium]